MSNKYKGYRNIGVHSTLDSAKEQATSFKRSFNDVKIVEGKSRYNQKIGDTYYPNASKASRKVYRVIVKWI